MFNRSTYKELALRQLKGRWLTPILITVFSLFFTALFFSVFSYINTASRIAHYTQRYAAFTAYTAKNIFYTQNFHTSLLPAIIAVLALTGIIHQAETLVYIILSRSREKVSFFAFISGMEKWLTGVTCALWKALWITLWSCLFYIPGIIKAIAYSQMYMLLVEHPGMRVRKAMKISKAITKGFKIELFLMYLSFTGWFILSLLTGGIGFIWLFPYVNMTKTNAYHALLSHALAQNVVQYSDFE